MTFYHIRKMKSLDRKNQKEHFCALCHSVVEDCIPVPFWQPTLQNGEIVYLKAPACTEFLYPILMATDLILVLIIEKCHS